MTSHTTSAFRKAFAALPGDIQDRAREAFKLFSEDPGHPSLQFKQVQPTKRIYSARVSLRTGL